MSTQVFLINPTNTYEVTLRRYQYSSVSKCKSKYGFHNAKSPKFDKIYEEKDLPKGEAIHGDLWPHDDPRWLNVCEEPGCGYQFVDTDFWQFQPTQIYANQDNSWRGSLGDAPPGAMYYATWLEDCASHVSPHDGHSLCVVLPDPRHTHWQVDARAQNCTLPNDTVHRCWVRSGSVEQGTVHVDKNGHTCSAGAGSIAVPGYHGFLHNGKLTD